MGSRVTSIGSGSSRRGIVPRESSFRAPLTTLLVLLSCLALLLTVCSCQGKAGRKKVGAGRDTLSAGQKGAGNNREAVPVEVARASRHTVRSYLTATSTLEALSTAQLLAETTGRVVTLYREEGDRVNKGQALIKLQDTQQKLDFEKAGIDLEMAERDWQRAQELEKRGILSAKEFDETRLRLEAAKHAKAGAQYELEKTRIVAPFSGIVTEKNVQLGETVTPGKHVATVSAFDPLVVRFHVPESEIGPVRIGQPVAIEIPSGPTETLYARISLISPIIDQGTGTVKLTAYLKNTGFRIKPGTFVRAHVVAAAHDSVLTIPKKALLSEDETHHVFVVASDTVTKVEVKPGITDNQLVEILSGLSLGDLVITVGHGGLSSGDKVKIVGKQ
ncbi:MAG: efflux RND transporter periplasmic adaptor subunit [Candidatus Eisenbacteria bacterium]|nr:efflux RND transporter periplasmic adaptor subunit [Candidatus Eisenbacteria bacterium]